MSLDQIDLESDLKIEISNRLVEYFNTLYPLLNILIPQYKNITNNFNEPLKLVINL